MKRFHLIISQRNSFAGLIILLLTFCCLCFSGCGNGGGSSDNNTTSGVQEGVFVDSPIQGLFYQTASQSGLTDENGTFLFNDGEIIMFFLGDLFLGQGSAKPFMNPVDLIEGALDDTDPAVINLCRFLQSLDEDGNLDNGIQINERIRSELQTRLSPGLSGFNFASYEDLMSLFNEFNAHCLFPNCEQRKLCTGTQALAHLRTTLGQEVCAPCEGKVSELTLRYNGTGQAQVRIVQKEGEVVFDDQVSSGQEFTIFGQDKQGTLSPWITVFVNDAEHTLIHTSCSEPIGPGLVSGDFEVLAGSSRNGGPLCPVNENMKTWYRDADGDGFGNPGEFMQAVASPSGYVDNNADCQDNDSAVHPGAQEVCDDGIDNDCDGAVDEDCPGCSDADQDGYCATDDCDDTNPAVNPGRQEACNDNLDNDCDGAVNEGCQVPCKDADRDGYCSNKDCDDTDAGIYPGAPETCGDGIDQDCDGSDLACPTSTWYRDADEDGYGDPGVTQEAVDCPAGYVTDNTDCDDTDPYVNPGHLTVCRLTKDAVSDYEDPSVYNNTIAWLRYGNMGHDWIMYLRDGRLQVLSENAFGLLGEPSIYGDAAAWLEMVNSHSSIKYWDGSTNPDGSPADIITLWSAPGFKGNACVYNGTVGWMADIEAPSNVRNDEILYWDGTFNGNGEPVVVNVSNSADENECNPWLHNGTMAWGSLFFLVPEQQWRKRLFYWNGSTVVKLMDDMEDETDFSVNPSLWNGIVTWNQDDGNDWEIVYWQGEFDATGKPVLTWVTENDWHDGEPFINDGMIVWPGKDPVDGDMEIYFWNGDEVKQITHNNFMDDGPAVHNGRIVWTGYPEGTPGHGEIFYTTAPCSGPDILMTYYRDADNDGYGDAADSVMAFVCPEGYVSDATDCNDTDAGIYPGADEICGDGIDQDCNGEDERCPVTTPTWHRDADDDGYGNPDSSLTFSICPPGYVADNTDCDDTNDNVYPGAEEVCDDGIDQDCDGADLSCSVTP